MIVTLSQIIRKQAWFIVLVFILPACNHVAVAPPPPTPISLRLAHTPALQPWVDRLAICASEQPEIALFQDEMPSSQLDTSLYDAVLRLGGVPNANEHAIVLGYDEPRIIVNALNPVQSLDEAGLRALFDGSMRTWELLSPPNAVFVVSVQPWIYLPESELSQMAFLADVIESKTARTARLASDPGQVIQGVRDDPGAFGIVLSSWLQDDSDGVKVLSLTSTQEIPVLAITGSEPQGALRNLLGCVTQGTN